jgi:hypothetical protein
MPSIAGVEERKCTLSAVQTVFAMTQIERNIEGRIRRVTAGRTSRKPLTLLHPILFRAEGRSFYLTKIFGVVMTTNYRLFIKGEMTFDIHGGDRFDVEIDMNIHKMSRVGKITITS